MIISNLRGYLAKGVDDPSKCTMTQLKMNVERKEKIGFIIIKMNMLTRTISYIMMNVSKFLKRSKHITTISMITKY